MSTTFELVDKDGIPTLEFKNEVALMYIVLNDFDSAKSTEFTVVDPYMTIQTQSFDNLIAAVEYMEAAKPSLNPRNN